MNKEHVKNTALIMVKESGLINLSRAELCQRAGIPNGSFPHVMGCNFTEFISDLKKGLPEQRVFRVSKSRTDPALRRQQILAVAIELARKGNYTKITQGAVAEEAGVSGASIIRYFSTMNQLRKAIMRGAILNGVPEIVAQGLACGDAHARKAPQELKNRAAQLIANC